MDGPRFPLAREREREGEREKNPSKLFWRGESLGKEEKLLERKRKYLLLLGFTSPPKTMSETIGFLPIGAAGPQCLHPIRARLQLPSNLSRTRHVSNPEADVDAKFRLLCCLSRPSES